MDQTAARALLESLASGVRLDVFRLLVRQEATGMVAGEIATALDVPRTNLSFHLKALTIANLATVKQEGRYQRYRTNLPLILDRLIHLTEEYCATGPDRCADIRDASTCAPAALPPLFNPKPLELSYERPLPCARNNERTGDVGQNAISVRAGASS